ncbi:BACON domain-containing protein [Alistipes sp.]|uniref:BACON domain-containing protein n=1 Tax=Alistipes sp. TaxID=1872444 RepID=UPI003AB75A4B
MKQLVNRWLRLSLCALLLTAAACSDDDTDEQSKQPAAPTLNIEGVPESGLHFLYFAPSPQTFTLSTDAPWEITKTAGWFIATPRKGEAGEQIRITVTGDRNEGDARTGELTVRANSGNYLHPVYTEKTFSLSQDAYLAAGITVTGIDEDQIAFPADDPEPVVLQVNASYDWTLTVNNETWVTVAPKSGKAGAETTVTVTPKANTENKRNESTLTITAQDPEFSGNSAERVIALSQVAYLPVDSHAEGYSFFSDDFSWIPANWVSPYSKYGWPTVNVDGTNGNEFALSVAGMAEAVKGKGYTCTASTYARYEGYVKLGKTANMGAITIPALSGIDANKSATLLVQFNAAAYASAGGTVDNGDDKIDVSITGPGTIGDLSTTATTVEVKNVWSWTRYSLIVYGATAETRITFGSERTVKCRLYIDDISVVRAKDEGAEAPAPEAVVTPLEKEFVNTSAPELFTPDMEVVKEGGTLEGSLRINRAWTAETDCDWLTITDVKCGGAANGAKLADGVATVTATWLPYNGTKIEVRKNDTDQPRTGNIIMKVDGVSVLEIPITQQAGDAAQPEIVITGLTDNTVPEFAADAATGTAFTVRGAAAWTIEVPAGAWYSVSPLSGAADTDVTVTVTPTANTGGARSGSFTVKTAGEEQPIAVSQSAGANAVAYTWTFPADAEANGLANRTERWYKSDDGAARIDAVRAVNPSSNSADMSFTLGADNEIGRLLMYGFALDDYWLFTVPVTDFKANTTLNVKALISSSASGPKFYILEYSADEKVSWTPVNTRTIQDKAMTDSENRDITYTYMMPDLPANADVAVDDNITVPTAVASGNIYIRLRVCDAMAGNKAKNIVAANGGTTRIKTRAGTCPAFSVTEVQP